LLNIPNFITLLNAIGGCLALLSIFSGQILWLPWILAGCLMADFADGLVARLLKSSSEIGKQLDSLADVISFGAVPGAIFYYLINKSLGITAFVWEQPETYWGALGFILTAFSALRLAKFNIDTRQTENFVGLNTPATTMFVLGLLLTVELDSWGLGSVLLQLPLLFGLIGLFSYLLVSEIPIFSFKLKKLSWKGNEARFILLILAVISLIVLPFGIALMAIITLYVLISFYLRFIGKLTI
jgi:CDP-diacylglycerol--serine O-phosphatidyltransferase